jgi:glycerol-3-phosphate dehydrogenase
MEKGGQPRDGLGERRGVVASSLEDKLRPHIGIYGEHSLPCVVSVFRREIGVTERHKLSTLERRRYLEEMASATLDVLVIGGGITGAGCALDAASRGLRVGLVEKRDFASGTSSKSTKLIHGGLRYLKQGEFRLVREVGRERAILHRNAPHIVIPEMMLLPIVENGTYGRFATSIGLWVYDILAGVKREERRIMLSKQETLEREPLLRSDTLIGGGLYVEYRTDDTRLTIEVLKTARRYGANIVNYANVRSFIYDNGIVVGANVQDEIHGDVYPVYARKIVNAAGPWVDELRSRDGSLYGKRLHVTKGVHLVVPHHRFPVKQSVYFDVPDGRMIFAIPRDGCTYIGTTDTNYQGELDSVRVTMEDVEYLIHAVNHMFPSVHLSTADIVSSWAGLRPLIHEDGKAPSELSRKDEIFISPSGLISIAGGKLTGYRKMAERVVDEVVRQLRAEGMTGFGPCRTDSIVLSGGAIPWEEIPNWIDAILRDVAHHRITQSKVKELVYRYGSNTTEVVNRFTQLLDEFRFTSANVSEILAVAEAKYCVEKEMATNLSDFFIRRTGHIFFGRSGIPNLKPAVAKAIAEALSWRTEMLEDDEQAFQAEYESVVHFV